MARPTLRAQVAFDTAPLATPSWTTIHDGTTRRVLAANTSSGRQFELDPFDPATIQLELDNPDRAFDPSNTASAYYGKLLPRKRTRLQADWGTYLNLTGSATSGAYVLDTAVLDITGDIDIRAKVTPADWTPAAASIVIGKADFTGNFSWAFGVLPTGKLQLAWSPTGAFGALLSTDSTVAVGAADGATRWVRATMDVNDGAGNRVVKFYTSTDDTHDHTAVTWTQLGSTVTTAGTTSIFSGGASLIVGSLTGGVSTFTGKVYAAAVLNGIGGTVVAHPDFTDGNRFTPGAGTGVDSAGLTWTVSSPASLVAVTHDLAHGFVDRWPQDAARGFTATAKLTATDGFKILSQVDVASAFEEQMRTVAPAAWWRLGDAVPTDRVCLDSSGNHRDGVYYGEPGSTGSIVDGATGDAVEFDGEDDRVIFDGSWMLTAAPLSVVAWVQTSSTASTDPTLIFIQYRLFGVGGGATTFAPVVALALTGAGFAQFTARSAGPSTGSVTGAVDLRDGRPHMLAGTIDSSKVPRLYVDGTLVATGAALGSATLDTSDGLRIATGPVGGSGYNRFAGIIDELAVYTNAMSDATVAAQWDAGADPWSGDLPGPRITRFLDVAGWPAGDRDLDTGSSVMGPFASTGTTVLAAIQDAEATEAGRLWMSPAGKVTFRSRHSRATDPRAVTPQATFTDDGTATNPLHPTVCELDFSDDLIVNIVTVEWSGGAETVTDATSVAAYGPRSMTVQTQLGSSVDARSRAQWMLSRYAQPRVRPVSVTIRPSADARLWRPALTLRIGDRVTVRRRPADTGSVTTVTAWIEAVEHRISDGVNTWETTFGLSPTPTGTDGPGGPAIPNTFILGDPVYGRLGLNSLG